LLGHQNAALVSNAMRSVQAAGYLPGFRI